MILDKQAAIFRLAQDPSDADHEFYQPTAVTNFAIDVQPVSAQYEVQAGDTYGRLYNGYCLQTGIQIHDKIVISGTTSWSGMEYIVQGVKDWNFGPLPHFELLLSEAGA